MSNRFVTPLIRSVIVFTAFCLLLPTTGFAATLKIGGTGAALGTMRVLADEFVRIHPDVSVVIPDIGLATCRRIVERHSGGIDADGRLDEGTTFTVTLPVAHT